MRDKFWLVSTAALAVLALALAACAPSAPTESLSPVSPPAKETEPQPTAAEGDEASDIVAEARKHLAERLGISPDAVSLILIETVEWPDASLGCPQPGVDYAQVITPGFRIVLGAEGQEYVYHSGNGRFVLCEQPAGGGSGDQAPPVQIGDLPPKVQDLVEQARNDLSERLDVPVGDISLQSVEAVEWRDSSLGCPKPGMSYLQVITPGYRIRLQADGQLYEYHTDDRSVVYCEMTRPARERMGGKELVTAAAKEDLAKRLDVSVEQIEVTSIEYVDWPDASLGCTQPGMMYAQVITPGYRIILSASGRSYEYHTSLRGVVLCER